MANFISKSQSPIRGTIKDKSFVTDENKAGSKDLQILLGVTYELPEENKFIKGLEKKGLIERVPEPEKFPARIKKNDQNNTAGNEQ